MTTWSPAGGPSLRTDALTSATPLGILKLDGMQKLIDTFGGQSEFYLRLLSGSRSGCIGETCAVALIAGAAVLLCAGYISWHIPVAFLGTAGLAAWCFAGSNGLFSGDPVLHLLSGGILLGALFMATDYVTSPALKPGRLVFGAGCGLLTMLIRLKGGYPEGVMFSILIMNCFTPLIDRAFRPRVFGSARKVGGP